MYCDLAFNPGTRRKELIERIPWKGEAWVVSHSGNPGEWYWP